MSKLTIRIRSSKGVQRIDVDSAGRISDLRAAIAKACGVSIEDQVLSRRDWWASTSSGASSGGARGGDDGVFADLNQPLTILALKNGDMLFLSSTTPDSELARPGTSMGIGPPPMLQRASSGYSLNGDTVLPRPTTSSSTGSSPSPRSSTTTSNSNMSGSSGGGGFEKLVFAGIGSDGDSEDSSDPMVVLLHTTQQAARDIASFATTASPSPAFTAPQSDDCVRLLHRVHERLEVISQSLLNLPLSTASTLGVDVSRNVARSVRFAIDPLPSTSSSSMNSNGDDDDLRPLTSAGNRPSSTNTTRPPSATSLSSSMTVSPSTVSLTSPTIDGKEVVRDARYWEERYLGLRVKALKMNNAGMRLKAVSEQNQLKFEQELALRDRTIADLQMTLRAFQSATTTMMPPSSSLVVDPTSSSSSPVPTQSPIPSPPSSSGRRRPASATRRHQSSTHSTPTPAFAIPAATTPTTTTTPTPPSHAGSDDTTVRRLVRPPSASASRRAAAAATATTTTSPTSHLRRSGTPPTTAAASSSSDDFATPSTIPLAGTSSSNVTNSRHSRGGQSQRPT